MPTISYSVYILAAFLILQTLLLSDAFSIKPAIVRRSSRAGHLQRIFLQAAHNPDDNDDEDVKPIKDSETSKDMITENEKGIPCLPPIGLSSFSNDSSTNSNDVIKLNGESKAVGYLSGKFELQYTCKVCDTRNSHKVSRLAYRQGVVITVCKGCMSKHLIADNLGWSDYIGGFDGDTNIESFMETIGRGDEVNRVSPAVFDLEQILYKDDQSIQNSSIKSDGKSFE